LQIYPIVKSNQSRYQIPYLKKSLICLRAGLINACSSAYKSCNPLSESVSVSASLEEKVTRPEKSLQINN